MLNDAQRKIQAFVYKWFFWHKRAGMNQFGQMNMQLSPMGPRQTPPLQHPGQLSQAGAMNQVSGRFVQGVELTSLLLLAMISFK